MSAAALCAWLVFWLRQRERWSMGAVLLAVLALGGAWHHDCWNLFGDDELGLAATEAPQPVCMEAIAYSPATIIGAEKIVRFGNPDKDKISTSYAERLNLSLRMHVKRYTRLTNTHSKSHRHHSAMTSLFPKWAIICGSNNDGHVAGPIYKSHGATVLNTAEWGAVTVTIDAEKMDVETFRRAGE
jgi:hypothetical protein